MTEKMVKCFGKIQCRRLTLYDFNLAHDNPALFVKSQYGPVWIATLWNGVWCTYFLVTLLLDIFYYTVDSQHFWLLYVSNWGYILSLATATVQVIVRLFVILRRKDIVKGDASGCPWYSGLQWVLYNTNNVTSLILTSLFYKLNQSDFAYPCVNKHLLTTVYVVVNTSIISSEPVKLFHFYQPMTFAIFYVIVTAIAQSQIDTDVDSLILDWTRPMDTAILSSCVVLLIVPLVHVLFYCLYQLRIFVHKTCSDHIQTPTFSKSTRTELQRDITTTDVVLEDQHDAHYVDVTPDIKDDTRVKLSEEKTRTGEFSRYNCRLYKSETDLRDYRFKNGFYCDFAKPSSIFHHKHSGFSRNAITCETENNNVPQFRGSQIIVVKTCKKCTSHKQEDDDEGSISDSVSTVSSDFLPHNVTDEIMDYL